MNLLPRLLLAADPSTGAAEPLTRALAEHADKPAAVKEILGLPANATVPALVAMGVAAEDGFPTHRFPVDRILRTV